MRVRTAVFGFARPRMRVNRAHAAGGRGVRAWGRASAGVGTSEGHRAAACQHALLGTADVGQL